MRISHLIFLSFFFILLLFATTTYINYRESEKVKENSEYVSLSTAIVQSGNRFQRNIVNMTSGLRGFLLTGENYFLQAYDSAAIENESIIKQLSTLLPDSSRQYHLLYEIKQLNTRWLNDFATPLRNAKIKAEQSEKNLPRFNQLYREKMFISEESKINVSLQQKLRQLINLEYEQRDKRRDILNASVQQTKVISFTLTTVSIILGFSVVSFLAYRISIRILTMVNMADSIAAGNYTVHTEEEGKDELSRLAQSLNHMARVLSKNFNELKQKNRELDQFAHIVSHDLKAPLRGIDNVISWIEEDHYSELTPKIAEYLELIKGRARRGENLIQGLLEYARIGKESPQKEKVQVSDLISEILENYTLKPGFTVEVSPLLPTLFTEKVLLYQVFSNLIGNAIKHNDKKEGWVRIYCKDMINYYEFYIEDNGPGISKNYHDKIFLIFQTLKERDSFESTGVGLAIVKKILDSRNEKISIISDKGEGALFYFTWKK
jgi:signal transduction histidine kinase